jgi:hypothetical protein
MSVTAVRELAREYETEIGGRPIARRRWACILSDNTLQENPPTEAQLLTAVGLSSFGDVHETLPALGLRKIQVKERFGDSPYHVEVIAEYGTLTANEVQPLSRPPAWTFSRKEATVPALFYYNGSGNNDLKPLVNSAYDYFEGLTKPERMIVAKVRKNFAAFPTSQMAAADSINSDSYFGGDPFTWAVTGIESTYTIEPWGIDVYAYWDTTCELTYRQSGHRLQLPDVGWNYLDGGEKRRAMVFDFRNGEWVASANPIGLDGSGNQTFGEPAILQRRVNPVANFTTLFGTPPS